MSLFYKKRLKINSIQSLWLYPRLHVLSYLINV